MAQTASSVDGTRIAFERSGVGPALILVGGALSDRRSAATMAAPLASDFTAYTYDRRGRGDSTDTAPYAVEREIEDLQAIIDVTGGPALVYGHSSGAVLALEACARGVPVAALAVYEPPYMIDDTRQKPPADFAARVQKAVDAAQPDAATEAFLREAVGLPEEVVAMIKRSPDWPGMLAVAHTLPHDIAIVGDGSMPTERLGTIAVPTLVMDGEASPGWARNAVAAVAAAVPGARRLTLGDQTHAVDPGVLASALVEFFAA